MRRLPPLPDDEDILGQLAMRFRGTRNDADRQAIAREYAETVDRLIRSGVWHEAPGPEDMLPDDCMPKAFFEYWSGEPPRPQAATLPPATTGWVCRNGRKKSSSRCGRPTAPGLETCSASSTPSKRRRSRTWRPC